MQIYGYLVIFNIMTEQEYMDLILKYSSDEPDDDPTLEDVIYNRPQNNVVRNAGVIDLTKGNKDKIIQAIIKSNNIRVYEFLIKIDARIMIDVNTKKSSNIYDIVIYEENGKNHFGMPNKLLSKVNPTSDKRFEDRVWTKYFNNGIKKGMSIDLETMYDIIKWLQMIKKLSAFV